MRTLMFVAVVFLVGVVGVGFCRGWFELSTETANQKPSATITMDKDKIHADEQKAKDEMRGFTHAATDKTGQSADHAK
jgi:hypothetical protein